MIYLWVKAIHLVSVICWMAGVLYLPRLFVYHSSLEKRAGNENESHALAGDMLSTMERRLLFYITTPSMVMAITLGSILLWLNSALLLFWWMHLKIVAALGMTVFTLALYRFYRDFRDNKNTRTGRFFRAINEIPTILMIIIVVLAITQP